MARDLAHHINSVPSEQREQLREMVVHVVRDEVFIAPPVIDRAGAGGAGAFSPFAIAIPLVLAGGLLSILFPPIGVMMFAAAGVSVAWGLLSVLISSGGD